LLLHPLDFLGADDGLEPLRFFPGMDVASTTKLEWLDGFIAAFRRRFDIVPIGAHVEALEAAGALPEFDPIFASHAGDAHDRLKRAA
jgi:hypothetical protein